MSDSNSRIRGHIRGWVWRERQVCGKMLYGLSGEIRIIRKTHAQKLVWSNDNEKVMIYSTCKLDAPLWICYHRQNFDLDTGETA